MTVKMPALGKWKHILCSLSSGWPLDISHLLGSFYEPQQKQEGDKERMKSSKEASFPLANVMIGNIAIGKG